MRILLIKILMLVSISPNARAADLGAVGSAACQMLLIAGIYYGTLKASSWTYAQGPKEFTEENLSPEISYLGELPWRNTKVYRASGPKRGNAISGFTYFKGTFGVGAKYFEVNLYHNYDSNYDADEYDPVELALLHHDDIFIHSSKDTRKRVYRINKANMPQEEFLKKISLLLRSLWPELFE